MVLGIFPPSRIFQEADLCHGSGLQATEIIPLGNPSSLTYKMCASFCRLSPGYVPSHVNLFHNMQVTASKYILKCNF